MQYTPCAYDDTYHWVECGCGEKENQTKHSFDNAADLDCNYGECGYTRMLHVDDWGDWTFNGDGTHTRVCKADSTHTQTGDCNQLDWLYEDFHHTGIWTCYLCGGGIDELSLDNNTHIYANDTDLTCEICGYVRTVEGELSITGSMPDAILGEAYSTSFGYTGTVSGVVFWNAAGLPDGLSINAGSGVISGTPAMVGVFSVTVSMGATGGGSASGNFTLTVYESAHTHSYSAANCTTPAKCECGLTVGDRDKSNHVGGLEIRDDLEPGEFTEGYTGDTYCLGCGDFLYAGIIIPATHFHRHSFQYNDTEHWEECSCGDTSNLANHYGYEDDGSCDACGYTREAAEHFHKWSSEWSANDWFHWEACVVDGCDLGIDELPFYESHSVINDDHIELGMHIGVCGICERYPAVIYLQYTPCVYDDTHHWAECACGAREEVEEHWFDDAIDLDCNYSECGYIRHVHEWGEWMPGFSIDRPHIRFCLSDGCGEIENKDHVFAWVNSGDVHHRQCWLDVCGFIDTLSFGYHEPAEQVCHTTTCIVCGLEDHTWSDWYSVDEIGHRRRCLLEACGVETIRYDHECVFAATDTTPAKCSELETIAPACTRNGYIKHTCSVCGDTYTDNKTGARGHWYGLWAPNGDGTHSADCKRSGCKYVGTAECTPFEVTVISGETEFTLTVCPVCGDFQDTAFTAILDAAIEKADTNALPRGEMIVRGMDAPLDGVLYAFTAAYEFAGKVEPFKGAVSVTLTLDAEKYTEFKLVRADVVSAAEGTERKETRTEIAFTYEEGKLSFEIDAAGLFLLIPVQ